MRTRRDSIRPKLLPAKPYIFPSYKEDAPILVNNLVPEPTPKEQKNMDKQTKTKDKLAGEDKEDTSEEQKGKKKEEETKGKEEDNLEESDSDLIY